MNFKFGQHYQQVVTDVGEEHLYAPLERDLLHGGERVQSGRCRRHPSSSSGQGFFSEVKVFHPCQGFRGVGGQVVHVACAGDCLLVQRVWLRGSPLPPSHPGLMIILIKWTSKNFIITDEYISYTNLSRRQRLSPAEVSFPWSLA